MTAELISRTGRVQQWLDNPESRLPVSCTVFVVEDSMEGENGIVGLHHSVRDLRRRDNGEGAHDTVRVFLEIRHQNPKKYVEVAGCRRALVTPKCRYRH